MRVRSWSRERIALFIGCGLSALTWPEGSASALRPVPAAVRCQRVAHLTWRSAHAAAGLGRRLGKAEEGSISSPLEEGPAGPTARVDWIAAATVDPARPPPADVPYRLPVELPGELRSPEVDPAAPYTPTVRHLLEQVLPAHPTRAQLANAVRLITGGSDPTCHAAGTNGAPRGTHPPVMPLCWADAQGINWLHASGSTTAPMQLTGLAATFDRRYANAWGQVEGREGRQLMVTGLLGPQVDLVTFVNWRRAVNSSSGEDPFLGSEMAVAQIDGLQGAGLMAQMKHFGPYNGTDETKNVTVQDQAMHEILLAPFEAGARKGQVAALMASYQIFKVELGARALEAARHRAGPLGSGTPFWPLDESHFSAENPWLLEYVLRDLWGSTAVVGPDYGGIHSSNAIVQGLDMEPWADYLGTKDPTVVDPSGSTCADLLGRVLACDRPGALHVAGIPSAACVPGGCGVADAVASGALPVAVLGRALAVMLYQEERFGVLGCDEEFRTCPNPGGVGEDRSGTAGLPVGPTDGAVVVGTKNGDAAIAERGAELGAVLLKNEGDTLPIRAGDLARGVSMAGGTAEYLAAAPFNEAATGFADRDAIGPLRQLETLSGVPLAFTYSPVDDATGRPVPSSALSTSSSIVSGYLDRTKDGGPPIHDDLLDYTTASGRGWLEAGRYAWQGFIYVPKEDAYTFRFQYSPGIADSDISFTLDGGAERTLVSAIPFYHGYYYGSQVIPVARTVEGYTEGGLTNRECQVRPSRGGVSSAHPCPVRLSKGFHAIAITLRTTSAAAFRFAYSRARGDIEDAAADARGKALAIVFANDDQVKVLSSQGGPREVSGPNTSIGDLSPEQEDLIDAVARANPRTVVVLNTEAPVVVPWIARVKSVLEMWNPGQEGGTATARLLLGEANPSGHTPITWPLVGTDTVYGHVEPADGLYPGSSAGNHPERLNGLPDGSSDETEGIYVGYRYYDKLGLPVRFAFGHGLSYARFEYSGLSAVPEGGGVTVHFTVRNVGDLEGAAVPQVYVGPAPGVPSYVQQALRALRGFDRVTLEAGQAKQVAIALDERSFQYWDSPSQSWVRAPGERTIWVGEGLDDLRLTGTVRIR